MRSKSPEKRGRQKPARAPTYRIENEHNPEAMAQCFQIEVNLLEGRNFSWINPQYANGYIIVGIAKNKYKTNIQKKTDTLYSKEAFIFDIHMSLRELGRKSLWFSVMEPKCRGSRLVGEAALGLGGIWAEPNHKIVQKWIQLNPTGFIKVSVRIIQRDELPIVPLERSNERLDDERSVSSCPEQQCANYVVSVYGAHGLPSDADYRNDKRAGKPPSTFVRVSFCGLVARTAIQPFTNNPVYCEQISMVEMFPNTRQVINFDVCANEGSFNRILCSSRLCLGDISHDGESGFLPAFGPSFLHLYANSNARKSDVVNVDELFHRGALFVAYNVIVPYYQRHVKSITVEPISPISPDHFWTFEDFCVYCPIFEVSMLSRETTGKFCGVAITIGEVDADTKTEGEFIHMMNVIRTRKLHYTGSLKVFENNHEHGYIDFSNAFPVLQFATRLPDFRFKMYRNNMIHRAANNLELCVNDVENRLRIYDYSCTVELIEQLKKALEAATGIIEKCLDVIQNNNSASATGCNVQYNTILEQKQLSFQKDEIEKIYMKMRKVKCCPVLNNMTVSPSSKENSIVSRKSVKLMLADMRIICQELKDLVLNALQGWADIVVWLLSGGSRVAFCKISPADVIYSLIPEQCGKDCARIQTIYMKPLKCSKHTNHLSNECHCLVGKVELLMWMGEYRQKLAFDSCLPGFKLKIQDYDMCIKSAAMMVECRAFVSKAKLKGDHNGLNASQTFLRIHALNTVKETKTQCRTLTPVWDQVLKIQRMLFMTQERLTNSPAIVFVEVYNAELTGNSELIGRCQVQPTVSEIPSFESAPKLQWHDLYRGMDYMGKVLMSVQLIQIPEKLLKNIIYCPIEQSYVAATGSDELDSNNNYTPIPKHLSTTSTLYKIDVYWWGVRNTNLSRKLGAVLEIEDLCIKSNIIDKKSNCNFPNGRSSHIFEAPINEMYCPMLNIRLFDSNSFGRMQYIGANIVKNPNKYVLRWLDKSDRDVSLRRASIISSEFNQVNQQLFIKKNAHMRKDSSAFDCSPSVKSLVSISKPKYPKWKRFLWRREPGEEEFTLLPVFSTKEDNKIPPFTTTTKQKDWWQKYLKSKKGNTNDDTVCAADKLILFDTELENQAEFSKFKDWCATLKLYNGKKTGIPERDKQLYCGLLKTGLAIYRWPPTDRKTAVTFSGIELYRGFFDDHPSNEPAKFLIRVYIVKGINLKAKEFVGKTSPYIVLSCGSKHLGSRDSHVPNELNPIFGEMYELQCNLPEDYLLTISLYDYDSNSSDELIGCTEVDLEDRIYTKHRARVGLSFEYSLNDLLKWRDYVQPSAILEEICLKNHLAPPVFVDNSTLVVNGIEYKDDDRGISFTSNLERKENLCLSILHNWHTLPVCGYHLVPEHVETRTLYSADRPGIEQGKLQMWVDIFPLDIGVYIPPPIDITPKKIENYELQVTMYTVRDININSNSLSRKSTDVYLRAWIGSLDLTKSTVVHSQYITKTGNNLNWQMIFSFQYQPTTREISYRDRAVSSVYHENAPAILNIQLMLNEVSPQNDCLGSLTLDLNELPPGVERPEQCTLGILSTSAKTNLFLVSTLRGWWPVVLNDRNLDSPLLVAKIYLEMNLFPQDRAALPPVLTECVRTLHLAKQIPHGKSSNGLCNKIRNWNRGRVSLALILAVCLLLVLEIVLAVYLELPVMFLEYWT